MRYAFLARNYREINFEKKVIFWSHVATMVACVLPWVEYVPNYEPIVIQNALQGYHYLLGMFLFTLSLIIVLLYLDRLFEKHTIKLPISENYVYAGVSLQQVFIIIMIWSVIGAFARDYTDVSTRFGIFVALIAQISCLVATFLNYQLEKQTVAQSFFQNPSTEEPLSRTRAKADSQSRFHNDIEE